MRLAFGGAEGQAAALENLSSNGTVNIDTTTPRSGAACYSFPSAADNRLFYVHTNVNSRTFYSRTGIYFSANPAVNTVVCAWGNLTNNHEPVTLTTTGTFTAPDGTASAAQAPGWHVIEMSVNYDGTTWLCVCRLDGAQLGGTRSTTPGSGPNRYTFGNCNTAAHAVTLLADDWAINDDQGSAQNSWCGNAGKVLLCKPTADSAIGTDWKLGDGTAISANAFEALNNVPPVGVANASGTAGSQLKDSVNNITNPNADMDLTMQTYRVAGLPAAVSTVNCTQAVASIAAGQGATSINVGTKILSNPADSSEGTLATDATSGGVYPSHWTALKGNLTSAPVIVPTTAPVMRIGKRGGTTNMVMTCFGGVFFEYDAPNSGDGQYIYQGVHQPSDARANGRRR